MTLLREKAFVGMLFLGVALAITTLVAATTELRGESRPPPGARNSKALDSGVGRAVPRAALYWFGAGAVGAFAGAYLVRER